MMRPSRSTASAILTSFLIASVSRCAALGSDLPVKANLQLWLKADVGLEFDASKVTTWQDQSGQGHHARAASATAPVRVRDGVNGRPAVRFDGARSFMTVAHAPGLSADRGLTVFCVYRYLGGFRIAQKKDRSSGLTPDGWFVSPGPGLGVAGRFARSPFFARGHAYLQTSVYDPSSAKIRVFSSGEPACEVTEVPPCKLNADPIHIGKRHYPGQSEGHLDGCLAELLIYNVAMPDDERVRVEGYLRDEYGLARYGQEALPITRVIPGRRSVTVDWLAPQTATGRTDLQYALEVKLRSAPWERAVVKTVTGRHTSATLDGLLNHADYSVRVRTTAGDAAAPLATSAERLASPSDVPGVVIDYVHKNEAYFLNKGIYIGSPSIARLPDGRLVASHDLFGCGSWDFSRIFRSDDAGLHWRHVADLPEAFWGKLFVHRDKLYMLACRHRFGDIVLHRSPDGGETWGKPVALATGPYHKAPVPITTHRGRLWTCVELRDPEFQAAVISVPVDADLMDPKTWTISKPLPYDRAWQPEGWSPKRAHVSEGNAVVDPQGKLLNILRYNAPPHYGKVVVLDIAPDGRSLSFHGTFDFHGSLTKFTIRRHPTTGVYWSLVNRVPEPRDGQRAVRNVLTLVKSRDLRRWTPVRDVLRDDRETAPKYTGYQYIDWLFDGTDIIFASRTAYNGAHNFHDANHLTFHRVRNFAAGPVSVGP